MNSHHTPSHSIALQLLPLALRHATWLRTGHRATGSGCVRGGDVIQNGVEYGGCAGGEIVHEVDFAGASLLLLGEGLVGFESGEKSAVCVFNLRDAGESAGRYGSRCVHHGGV